MIWWQVFCILPFFWSCCTICFLTNTRAFSYSKIKLFGNSLNPLGPVLRFDRWAWLSIYLGANDWPLLRQEISEGLNTWRTIKPDESETNKWPHLQCALLSWRRKLCLSCRAGCALQGRLGSCFQSDHTWEHSLCFQNFELQAWKIKELHLSAIRVWITKKLSDPLCWLINS